MVFLFHKDWNLVINMMIGINKAIRALWDVNDHQLQKSDYKMRDIFELNYKRSFSDNIGLKGTCIFYNYAPYIFADIRS
jgi:1-phosphatidylinositol-4-phosphate 5-kinase